MTQKDFDCPKHYSILVLGWPTLDVSSFTKQTTSTQGFVAQERITQLEAEVFDQSALYGLLDSFRDNNVVLLRLELMASSKRN